jgi:hypothetical protein
MRVAPLIAALLFVITPVVRQASAQLIGETNDESRPAARGYIAVGARGAQPLEDFANYIDFGYGFGGYVAHALDSRGVFSIRGSIDMLWYGHETTRHSLSDWSNSTLDVTTSNNIFSIGIGPYLTVPGPGVRPFLTGTVGFSYFSTSTAVKWRYSEETLDNWTDFSDGVTAWTGGGGLLIPLTRSQRPVLLELSAIYHGNGEAEYLREGSISRDDDGNAVFTPIRSRTNLVLYTIGVSFGAW